LAGSVRFLHLGRHTDAILAFGAFQESRLILGELFIGNPELALATFTDYFHGFPTDPFRPSGGNQALS
jgi:hypothetical protein